MYTRLSNLCVIGFFLTLTGPLHSDEPAEAKPVIDKAIKAMGDAGKLTKFRTGVAKGKVTGQEGAQEITVTFDASWRGLDHYRLDAEISHGGMNMKGLIVVKGDQAWARHNDRTEEAPAEIVPLIKNIFHAMRMPQLVPSLKDAGYKLSVLGEAKIGEKPALGLTVARKDYQDVTLHFDKESGLPVKSEVLVSGPGGKEVHVEFLYADYKETNGVKQPTKITIKGDDREFTMQLEQVKAEEKLEDSVFEKP
jgi:hypothetical protein